MACASSETERSLVAGTFETASLVVNLCAGAEGTQARVEALESGAMLDLVKLLTAGVDGERRKPFLK